MKVSYISRLVGAVALLGLVSGVATRAQGTVLINEVIADNEPANPQDIVDSPDMIELYNDSDEAVELGTDTDATSYYLSDGCAPDSGDDCLFPSAGSGAAGAWRFPAETVIPANGFLVVYCEVAPPEDSCGLQASFEIASNGDEPIILWGPEDGGTRPMVDRVFLPPLGGDIAFGRMVDGAGGPNLSPDETLDFFVHTIHGSFGCEDVASSCGDDGFRRLCEGAPNSGRAPLEPSIELLSASSNRPDADTPVVVRARVRDEQLPIPENLSRVEIMYRVDGAELEQSVPMRFESLFDRADEGRPLSFFSVWVGEIPGQSAGAVVQFRLLATDLDGLEDEDPNEPCYELRIEGPCNELGLPGADCTVPDDKDPVRRFEDCNAPYRYRVAHDPGADLGMLVINEIVPLQTELTKDTTDDNYEDYIELYNGSGVELDLSGLWLSDRAFEPQGTEFPPGSKIAPDQHLIVWLDNDGYRCPRPDEYDESDPDEPQKCPDPTDPSTHRYHTNFRLDADGEAIYLFDRVESGLGLIHGFSFGPQEEPDIAFALCPDGDPDGTFVVQRGTPGRANSCVAVFRRGDVNGDCSVNITDPVSHLENLFQGGGTVLPCEDAADANDDGTLNLSDPVFVLNYLFSSGSPPNAPGPKNSGPDPTDDSLGCNTFSQCP